MITYLTYKEIDKKKWDDCINNAVNGLIYAEAAYLDHMAANWDALILDNYDAVMPLTWKRKWGIQYLYQPAFIQQGGIFFKKKISSHIIKSFIDTALTHFKFAECTMNFLNPVEPSKGLQISNRNNFILPLGRGYKKAFLEYNIYIKQRLSRLQKFSLKYKDSHDFAGTIALYKKLYKARMSSVTTKDYLQFEKLCTYFSKLNRMVVRQVYNNDETDLLATILLLRDKKRLYNIISCILPEGKKLLANYFLYNEVVREFANEDIILDFEGSDIPGVSYFYNKFSHINQRYYFIKFNRLPLPIKLLKK